MCTFRAVPEDDYSMEGSLEATPPTPATPCAAVDPSPHRSPDPSLDAADGASAPPTPQHPARLFAPPQPGHQASSGLIIGPVALGRQLCPHCASGFLLRRVSDVPARDISCACLYRDILASGFCPVLRHAFCLHAYSDLTCLSLFWERTGLLYLYMEGPFLFGGPSEYMWWALLCLEGLMSRRVFACGGPVPLPLSPLPGCE